MGKYDFSIAYYGEQRKFNEVLTIARCRVFYKGLNRNASFITDEFAERLIKTLPYTPVKGIYNSFDEDYGDHGKGSNKRTQGRIYGIVPDETKMDFAWEDHTDSDGITRTYACTNVFLFTGIYKEEAEKIIEKSQSMEIYEPSIIGHYEMIQGSKCFVFEEGCFVGLQVLGDSVTPCFEGAAFFELYNSLVDIVNQINNFQLDEGGQKTMSINFKLSDGQKQDKLFYALNTNFTEEGNWTVEFGICEVYDNYALVFSYESDTYERAYYSKGEDDSIEITSRETTYIVDVTKSEYDTLNAIQALNNNSFENLQPVVENGLKFEEEKTQFEQKLAENEETISTLITERDQFSAQCAEAQSQNETLMAANAALTEYKNAAEQNKKDAIIAQYSARVDADRLEEIKANAANFSIVDLEKELALALVQNDPSIFSVQGEGQFNGFVPHAEGFEEGSLEALIQKHKNS